MFSGAGEFFRPVELRKDLPPIAHAQPAPKTGDDDPRKREEFQRRLSDIVDETAISGADAVPDAPAEDLFGDDFIELSLPALHAMLTGDKTAHAYGRPPVQASPAAEPALAAYRRAADAAPDTPAPDAAAAHMGGADIVPMPAVPNDEWRAAAAQDPTADAGSAIFYMLAALEKAGVPSVTVKDRQTIYTALRRRCADLGVPMTPPSTPLQD